MKTTADAQDGLLVCSRAVVAGIRPWVQPAAQSSDTNHLFDDRLEDHNGEFARAPYPWQDLLETVCPEGSIDAKLTRGHEVALDLDLNARDRFE